MYSDLKTNEKKRQEVITCLYRSLTENWSIPKPMQDYYGLTEDYRLYWQLESMDYEEYKRKVSSGELPDILEVDARLTHAAERILESICPRLPVPYLEKLNEELEKLGRIAFSPNYVHDILHIHPDFLVKYGIDKDSPEDTIRKQAEKAYRELDARFVRMTGRRSYADELFGCVKSGKSTSVETVPRKKAHIKVRPKPRGRKMGL